MFGFSFLDGFSLKSASTSAYCEPEYGLSLNPMTPWINKDTPESRDGGQDRKPSQQQGCRASCSENLELIYQWGWIFFGYKISGEQVACPAVHIILGNRLYIIHCTSYLKHIQASGKSEGSWSDPTSNNAFEAPTDDRCDG